MEERFAKTWKKCEKLATLPENNSLLSIGAKYPLFLPPTIVCNFPSASIKYKASTDNEQRVC
jgi:hypothetical protein